jgi:serine/threonine protein kinase
MSARSSRRKVASALDHAHRKRDHNGKPLGIVHRDVSPQNVLISYAGEVKLVDFGIAKATMKVRQTAVGVIKGKYYYMSPEQAWGDQVDWRSDIFSAGIVLYEMITGQMLYLEEDLHKLLDMARKATSRHRRRCAKAVRRSSSAS